MSNALVQIVDETDHQLYQSVHSCLDGIGFEYDDLWIYRQGSQFSFEFKCLALSIPQLDELSQNFQTKQINFARAGRSVCPAIGVNIQVSNVKIVK